MKISNVIVWVLWLIVLGTAVAYGTGAWADDGDHECKWHSEDFVWCPAGDRIFANGFENYCDDDDGDDDGED